jgi:hypothetical protein
VNLHICHISINDIFQDIPQVQYVADFDDESDVDDIEVCVDTYISQLYHQV